MATKAPKRSRAHTRYKNKEGQPIPGVTTVLNVLAKPALIPWANKLGLAGIKSSTYVDEMAIIGTLAHEFILAHFKKEEPDTSEYSQKQIDKAENCFISFLEWSKGKNIKPILIEEQLVSEKHGFGGTIDLYAEQDNALWLTDFKTSKGIWPEMFYQIAAYRALLVENGHSVDKLRIIRIGRSEDEGFEERLFVNFEPAWQLFKHCLAIYHLKKEVK